MAQTTGRRESRPTRPNQPAVLAEPPSSPSLVASLTSVGQPNDEEDEHIISEEEFQARISHMKKQDLRNLCTQCRVSILAKETAGQLRSKLLARWQTANSSDASQTQPPSVSAEDVLTEDDLLPPLPINPALLDDSESSEPTFSQTDTNQLRTAQDPDAELVVEFGLEGAEEILGYGEDEGEDEDDEGGDYGDGEDDDNESGAVDGLEVPMRGEGWLKTFQNETRVNAARRAELNRRSGGIKTQKSIVKAWENFIIEKIRRKEVQDNIVDEHSLLLWINHIAERPKMTRRGVEIPGTRIGASHIKKLFFGVLRVRKEQEAADRLLKTQRPATSVHVWDSVKTRMDEALERLRNGDVGPQEDAPDITANTFLADASTDEGQMQRIGMGFLQHRQLAQVVKGHLIWTWQNGSGNRGDDIRALKLSELQPYKFLHPNGESSVSAVLGLQGEEKAGKRGMKTMINPVYSALIAHRDPLMCPLGGLAFYFHWLFDVFLLEEKLDIDWKLNKSWRKIRFIFGSSPTVPYNESSLYSIIVNAFKKAGFASKLKAHFARHILGYRQEQMGVSTDETTKLGWSRDTFMNTYAPALPKTAILGAHGYKKWEIYGPFWREVFVPEAFLKMICPMAENIINEIEGKDNLSGATKFWKMVIELRPYVFQCGAASFQIAPHSSLFRLPAFQHPDVIRWMSEDFPARRAELELAKPEQLDLTQIQDVTIRRAFEESRASDAQMASMLTQLLQLFKRRTDVLSPTKGFSNAAYHQPYASTSTHVEEPADADPRNTLANQEEDDFGIYGLEDGQHRAFICPSPSKIGTPRTRTQVDFVLPHPSAFYSIGEPQRLWQPVLGQRAARWEHIFSLIKRPELLWEVWQPKALDRYADVMELWQSYNEGEPVMNSDGQQTGVKPPLRMVEAHFRALWRKKSNERKAWSRYREIPDYIEKQRDVRNVSPLVVVQELDARRVVSENKGVNALSVIIEMERKESKSAASTQSQVQTNSQAQPIIDMTPEVDPFLSSANIPAASSSSVNRVVSEGSSIRAQSTSSPQPPEPSSPTPAPKKKRAPAVDHRGKTKKFKAT